MSDIITRLLLKTDDFDAKLTRSKAGVNSYQNDVSSMAKTAGAGIAKFAGGIGLAMGATEAFTKILGSQQVTQDEWDNNIFAAKLTVDKFFTSINNGDWTSFQDGFINSLRRAKELSAEIDTLNDKRLSLTYIKSEALASIEENKAIATDTSQPLAVRRKAFAAMQQQRIDLERKTNETIKKETDVLIQTLNVKYGELGWSEDDVLKFVVETNFTGGSSEFLDYKKKLEDLRKAETKITPIAGGVLVGSSVASTDKAAVEKTRQFKIQNQHLEKQRILEQEIDESRRKTVALLAQQAGERRELASLAKAENRIEKQLVKGGGGKKEETPSAGSLAYFDAEIAKANKELINATTAQARTAVQATISELEKQRVELIISDKGDSIGAISMQIATLKDDFISAITDEAREEIQKLINELDRKISYMKGKAKAPLKKSGIPTSSTGISKEEIKDMKLPNFKSPISKKDVKLNEEYADSLTVMGTIMGTLSGAFDSNTASVLQWGSALFTTIAQAIPAIIGMMEVKATDTTVTQANTTAEVGNATAKMLSAHAGIPFAGIAIGLAGVASIIAAMSSTPKFATGGIVPGSSFAGDNVLARVNSGEMILNAGQQGNLFRMLSGQANTQRPVVGNISNLIMPSGETNKVEVFGRLVAKGTDLETVITNRVRKTGKKLW